MIRNPVPVPITEVALTTVVLVAGVMVPILAIQGLILGYGMVLQAIGWR